MRKFCEINIINSKKSTISVTLENELFNFFSHEPFFDIIPLIYELYHGGSLSSTTELIYHFEIKKVNVRGDPSRS